ncbi:PEP-utilizing enzyme [Nocardiopsis dassonvillei]
MGWVTAFLPRPATRIACTRRDGWAVSLAVGAADALLRPERARVRAYRAAARSRAVSAPPARISDPAVAGRAAERMRFVRGVLEHVGREALLPSLPPTFAALASRSLPALLLRGVVEANEVDAALRGAPHNVTTDMDLELWRLADGAGGHRDLLLRTPPAELAARHLAGELPEFGLTAFLDAYGHRCAAEVDVGVPRWSEDPAPVFASIANYLRVTDPEQAPDRRFARAAREAEAALADVARRGRRARPVRGLLAALLLRRARDLAGLRELPKFIELYPLAQIRRQLLTVGAELAASGRLDGGGDVLFLTLAETEAAVASMETTEGAATARGSGALVTGPEAGKTADGFRALAAGRRRVHERETRRSRVPSVLLSDGTEVETVVPRPPAPEGALTGVAAAPGRARGRARVVLDPSRAHLEPGEILVVPTTDPGWTPLFLTAGGLVSETGSAVSHWPTVAREYGIPAVVGVRNATRRIATGQWITVDGAAGTVTADAPEAAGTGERVG